MTGLERDNAKTANFAKGYGSGVKTFAKTIGKSVEEAAAIMAQYDARLPFVSKLFHIEQEKAPAPASPSSMTARCGTGVYTHRNGEITKPVRIRRHSAVSPIPSIPGTARNCVAPEHARRSMRWCRASAHG